MTEGVDIHVVGLYDPAGTLSAVLVHLVPIGFLCAGLLRAARLAGAEQPVCHCSGSCRCGCQTEDDASPAVPSVASGRV